MLEIERGVLNGRRGNGRRNWNTFKDTGKSSFNATPYTTINYLHNRTFTLTLTFLWLRSQNSPDSLLEHLLPKHQQYKRTIIRSEQKGLHYVASGNERTCFRPRCVRAEHSMYLTARILLAIFCPCSRLSGVNPCSSNAVIVSRSSRKSILVPKNTTINNNK